MPDEGSALLLRAASSVRSPRHRAAFCHSFCLRWAPAVPGSAIFQLAPYQPYIIGMEIGCLGYGYRLPYRSSQSTCEVGGRASNRLVKNALILATVLVIAAIGFNLLAPLLNS